MLQEALKGLVDESKSESVATRLHSNS